MPSKHYSPFNVPTLSMSELVCKRLDHDATDLLIDKWLESRNDAYGDWFKAVRHRKHMDVSSRQILLWTKGEFAPENIFCRTVDTGRLIPLDRTWTTHVYLHKSMNDRKLSMMPVVFTMLPELMLLRGMHDHGCDDIYIIVTDLRMKEMDDVTEYLRQVCRLHASRSPRPSLERWIMQEHIRLSHTFSNQRRTPCFPQLDLTFRAILNERRPPFIIVFSHQTSSCSQVLFTHQSYVPAEHIYYDFPSGCPNPNCKEDCEMVRFPRHGQEGAIVLAMKRRPNRLGGRIKTREMCNWIECDVCFDDYSYSASEEDNVNSEHSIESFESSILHRIHPQMCSKCRLVKYCCAGHQKKDWEEHRRVCVKC